MLRVCQCRDFTTWVYWYMHRIIVVPMMVKYWPPYVNMRVAYALRLIKTGHEQPCWFNNNDKITRSTRTWDEGVREYVRFLVDSSFMQMLIEPYCFMSHNDWTRSCGCQESIMCDYQYQFSDCRLCWCVFQTAFQGPVSISEKTSFRKIS